MPTHLPERTPIDGAEWNVDVIKEADKLGFEEAWIGEHFTMVWDSPAAAISWQK